MQSFGRRFLFTQIHRIKTVKNAMSTSVPQIRPLIEGGLESPVPKKARLNEVETMGVEDDVTQDEVIVIQEDGSTRGVSSKRPQTNAKRKKRRDPPLPEACSPADVLYKEIRKLLGEDVVDGVTKSGKAFSSPCPHGEELEVKIEMLGSGGESVGYINHTSFAGSMIFLCV